MLSITLQGQNLFKTMKINVKANGSNFLNSIAVHPEMNIINLSLSYNFNNFKKLVKSNQNVDINVNEGL